MNIISLVENRSECGLKTAHGLSLYIETKNHKILFDLGVDNTFVENAQRLGVDLRGVDTVIISHGHRDHGGALALFLSINSTAKIYIQSRAFLSHFSHRSTMVTDISLDQTLKNHTQIELVDGDYAIDSQLQLFSVIGGEELLSSANNSLYEGDKPDRFEHEQNLIVSDCDGSKALILGCGHCGVVNILSKANRYNPKVCVGGFHLTNPSAGRDESKELLDAIVDRLKIYSDIEFYTCHCTGVRVFEYLSSKMDNIHYFSTGMKIKIDRDGVKDSMPKI